MKNPFINWKTNLAAIVVLASTIANVLNWITAEQSMLIINAATVFGLASAKDGNVTGGNKAQ